jgi:hypothetical protein
MKLARSVRNFLHLGFHIIRRAPVRNLEDTHLVVVVQMARGIFKRDVDPRLISNPRLVCLSKFDKQSKIGLLIQAIAIQDLAPLLRSLSNIDYSWRG